MFETLEPARTPLQTNVKVALALWFVLLVPWLPLATMGVGMASEAAGYTDVFALALSLWSYPVLMVVAFLQRRRRPNNGLAPIFSVVLTVLAALLLPR